MVTLYELPIIISREQTTLICSRIDSCSTWYFNTHLQIHNLVCPPSLVLFKYLLFTAYHYQGKTIALITLVFPPPRNVLSFMILSKFVVAFSPRIELFLFLQHIFFFILVQLSLLNKLADTFLP